MLEDNRTWHSLRTTATRWKRSLRRGDADVELNEQAEMNAAAQRDAGGHAGAALIEQAGRSRQCPGVARSRAATGLARPARRRTRVSIQSHAASKWRSLAQRHAIAKR